MPLQLTLQFILIIALIFSGIIGMLFLPFRNIKFSDSGFIKFFTIKEFINRKDIIYSSFFDNLALYLPTLTIGFYISKTILASYSFVTRIMMAPQVLLSSTVSNYVQLNFLFLQKRIKFTRILAIILIVIVGYIMSYTLAYFIISKLYKHNHYFQDFSSATLLYLLVYYSIRLIVNPLSIVLFITNNFRRLKNVQLVLFMSEIASIGILVLKAGSFLYYLYFNISIGVSAYLFYFYNIYLSMFKDEK